MNLIYNNFIEYFNNVIKNNTNNKDDIIMNLQNELIKKNLDKYIENIIIKENKDIIVNENNIMYQLTSSYNQKNNYYNNIP